MKKRKFDKNGYKVKQVKYKHGKDTSVYNVIGRNVSERLFQLDFPRYMGGETWVRCENVKVVTKQNC